MLTSASLPAKKRILQVCVRLFLEKGYKKTTMAEIIEKADVSNSSFQNIFKTKDGVLVDLVEYMFSAQFDMAKTFGNQKMSPVCVYAVETAIQLAITELNENLREIYVEAYAQKDASEYIYRQTTKELYSIFGTYLPQLSEDDFYVLEIGSAGLMCAYMAYPCNESVSFEAKIRSFLLLSLRAYNVPEREVMEALALVESIDIKQVAQSVIQELLKALAVRYEFSPIQTN